MADRKKIRTRGKFSFSDYFRKFKDGDIVAVVKERAVLSSFPERLQGRTGIVIGKRGKAYNVQINDQTKPKQFLIEPVHLKKILQIAKK